MRYLSIASIFSFSAKYEVPVEPLWEKYFRMLEDYPAACTSIERFKYGCCSKTYFTPYAGILYPYQRLYTDMGAAMSAVFSEGLHSFLEVSPVDSPVLFDALNDDFWKDREHPIRCSYSSMEALFKAVCDNYSGPRYSGIINTEPVADPPCILLSVRMSVTVHSKWVLSDDGLSFTSDSKMGEVRSIPVHDWPPLGVYGWPWCAPDDVDFSRPRVDVERSFAPYILAARYD